MEKNMEQLKAEATELGLDFTGIKSKVGMQELIDTKIGNVTAEPEFTEDDIEIEVFEAPEGVQPELTKEDKQVGNKPIPKEVRLRQLIAKAKTRAMKKRVVTIFSNDKRDNDETTTTYLGFENQYFGMSKIVPLGIAVEIEQCLIDVAKSTLIPSHVAETSGGKRTGGTATMMVKKFSVSVEGDKA